MVLILVGVVLVVSALVVVRLVIARRASAACTDSLWDKLRNLLDGRPTAQIAPYRRVDALLTPAERSFYEVLRPLAEERGLHVFPKVRLPDLLFVPRGVDDWRTYQNRIQQKHLDFVLCESRMIRPVLAVELDDSSHRRSDRAERDNLVDEILEGAGLPILRVAVRHGYRQAELAAQLDEKLAATNALDLLAPVGVERAPAPLEGPSGEADDGPIVVEASALVEGPRCPRCGSILVERRRRQGGERFWGCPNYPSCRYTRPGTVSE